MLNIWYRKNKKYNSNLFYSGNGKKRIILVFYAKRFFVYKICLIDIQTVNIARLKE